MRWVMGTSEDLYNPLRRVVVETMSLARVIFCLLSTDIMAFGDFNSICEKTPVPLCLLVGPASSISGATGIVSNCYARNIELANTMIFQGAASFMHINALGMTVIMILHIRSKFTAVGSFCSSRRLERSVLLSLVNRAEGNHYLLLSLYGSDDLLLDY